MGWPDWPIELSRVQGDGRWLGWLRSLLLEFLGHALAVFGMRAIGLFLKKRGDMTGFRTGLAGVALGALAALAASAQFRQPTRTLASPNAWILPALGAHDLPPGFLAFG